MISLHINITYYVAWAEHLKFLDCTKNSHWDKLLPVAFRNHFVHIFFISNILCDGLPKQPYAVNGPQNQRMNVPANWKTYCNPLAFTWKMAFMPMVEEVLFILHHSHARSQRMVLELNCSAGNEQNNVILLFVWPISVE